MTYESEETVDPNGSSFSAIGQKFAPMKREYDRTPELQHWQGRYKLPRLVRRALKRPLDPLLLSGRRRTIMAVDALLTLIGRYHTSPRTFGDRGCGIGLDGGFALDRRGLSGQSEKARPPGCDGLTEWGVREATQFLIAADIIERVTPYAKSASTDKNGRVGLWLTAKKDKDGRIKAPPIRYRLTRLYRALFSKTLGLSSPPDVSSVKSPVGEVMNSFKNEYVAGEVGVSTGDSLSRPSRTIEEWLLLAPQIREEIAAAEAAKRKKAVAEELAARAARRPFNGLDRLPF